MVHNIEKFKKALANPLPRILNYRIFFYICFNTPVNGVIPLPEQIAKELKIEIKIVREEIEKLKYYGILSEDRGKDPIQYVSLPEASWRKRQIELIKEQLKEYNEAIATLLSNFESTHTRGKLNNIEMDFMITANMVHRTFIKAHEQCALAVNSGDREALQQARHFIKLLTNWLTFCDPKIDLVAEGWGIKDMVTDPKLIYL